MRRPAIVIALVCCALASPGAQTPSPAPRNDYGAAESWLCRPGRQDACTVDLTTTVIAANGKLTRETWTADPDAPIDCFYVYPTVSNDTTPNSDMDAGPEEKRVILHQFARFASKCRPYAPLYRQITLATLRAMVAGRPVSASPVLGYSDVRDAWNWYLAHDNNGRGVVLIGHSQGSGVLTALIHNEIDGKPIMARIVSALLLGTTIPVPQGKDVGGAFKDLPLCHAATQTGCLITYASFRVTAPPPPNTRFGKTTGVGMVAACTNPAALGGGSGDLHAYLGATATIVAGASAEQRPWVTPSKPITTTFVSVPGMLTAECVSNENGSYLAISVHADPAGPRATDIAGDVVVNGERLADWGLHLIDVNVAMGNLVDIIGRQATSYLAAGTKK